MSCKEKVTSTYVIALTLFVLMGIHSPNSTAHNHKEPPHHQHRHSHSHSHSHSHDNQKSELDDFLHEAHHSLEGDHEHGFSFKGLFPNWIEKLNFKKVILNTIRWAEMKSTDEKFKAHVKNLMFLYPLSHGLEMASGPVGVFIAREMGLSAATQLAIGSAGLTISVPGLDPLCWVLFAAYPLGPVQKSVTALREVSTQTACLIDKYSGFHWLRNQILTEYNPIGEAQNHDYIFVHFESDGSIRFYVSFGGATDREKDKVTGEVAGGLTAELTDELTAELTMELLFENRPLAMESAGEYETEAPVYDQVNSHYFLSEMQLSGSGELSPENIRKLQELEGLFNFNVRSAMTQVKKAFQKGESHSARLINETHIKHVEATSETLYVQFKDHSLTLRPRKKLCLSFLKGQ